MILTVVMTMLPTGCSSFQPKKENLEYGGTIEAYSSASIHKKKNTENFYGEIHARPFVSYKPTENWLLYVKLDSWADTAGYTKGSFDFARRSGYRSYINIREAFAEYSSEWFKVKVGQQIFNWSVTDTISPSDNICPRNWTRIFDWERDSVPAINLRVGKEIFGQAIVSLFTPSKLPAPGGRWGRELPPGVQVTDQDIPSRQRIQFAGRVGGNVKGIDLTGSVYYGYSVSPFYRIEPISLKSAQIIPGYNLETVYAHSAAKSYKGFNFRAEAGYFAQHRGDRYLQGVLGVDREFNKLFTENDSLTLLLQYQNHLITKHDNPLGARAIDFRRSLDGGPLARIQYSLDSEKKYTLKVEGFYNFSKGDSYVSQAFVWKYKSFETEVGVRFLSGGHDTFMGNWGNNSEVYLKTKFYF